MNDTKNLNASQSKSSHAHQHHVVMHPPPLLKHDSQLNNIPYIGIGNRVNSYQLYLLPRIHKRTQYTDSFTPAESTSISFHQPIIYQPHTISNNAYIPQLDTPYTASRLEQTHIWCPNPSHYITASTQSPFSPDIQELP